jgi:RNA polymerase sigma-70 factor (ECF subfamily)
MAQRDAAAEFPIPSTSAEPPTDSRGPGHQAIGGLLESSRPYLLSIARRELPADLRGKCDAADLVQETLLEAHRGFGGFNGTGSDGLRVWLCGILRHNLMDLIRRYRDASKRSIGRERSLEAVGGSGDPSDGGVDPNPTPCTQSIAREDVTALREALSRLPEHERSVIALRFFDLLPFDEIGRRQGCSPEAARKLCSRATTRLQRMLKVNGGSGT